MKKKYLAFVPVLTVAFGLSAYFVQARADVNNEYDIPNNDLINIDVTENSTKFVKWNGTITEIRNMENGSNVVQIQNEEDSIIDFIAGENTVFVTQDGIEDLSNIKAGDVLTVYYIEPEIMTMIYPPQIQATVFVKTDESLEIKVDYFDESLLSQDQQLMLNLSDETEIMDKTGSITKQSPEEKDLVVFYTVTTRSIPAQTSPSKIIILDEQEETEELEQSVAVPPIYHLTPEEIASLNQNLNDQLSQSILVVDDIEVEAPKGYVNEDGVIMLPLRPIVEALDYEVTWNNETKSIHIGYNFVVTPNVDSYAVARMEPVSLGTAPAIIDGVTYVPIAFIQQIMNLSVMMTDQQVIIRTIG